MTDIEQRIAHLEKAAKRLLDAQAVWWAAFTVAQSSGGAVPVPVRLELMEAQWQGLAPGPEVSMMFDALAGQMTDRDWWFLVCSYGEYRSAVDGDQP